MNGCERIRIEMSAMMDGESDPWTALTVVDHVAACPECAGLWRDMRRGQAVVERLHPVPAGVADTAAAAGLRAAPRPAHMTRARQSGRSHRFWGLAAVVVLAVGLGAIGLLDHAHPSAPPAAGGTFTIRLGEDRGGMDERRFVEMTTELLRADRRYHEKMLEILDRVRDLEITDESPRRTTAMAADRGETSRDQYAPDGPDRIVN